VAILIKWNKQALVQFDEIIAYIDNTSPKNAITFRDKVLALINSLKDQPEKFAPDKYKSSNDGSFRAFEFYHYRLSYRYYNNEIRILRIRHTKRNPLQY
jgi:plasmid stabilization system protein ParE